MSTITGNRNGYGLVGVMVAIVAAGLLMVPLTRWYISMTSGTEGLQDKLAMQAIIQDHWLTLNDEGFDELSAAIATKGSTWTENVGEGGRYTITTSFGGAGKYVNAACTDGTPGTDERQCRKVSVQIKDNVTGQTQALNLTKVASQTDTRLKTLETKANTLDGKVATAQSTADAAKSAAATAQSTANTAKTNAATAQSTANTAKTNAATAQSTANTANTNANSALSKFGSYYTAAQVDSKISSSSSSGATQKVWVATDTCHSIALSFKNGLFQRISDTDSCGD